MLWIISGAMAAFAVLWAVSVRRLKELRAALVAKDKDLIVAKRAAQSTADVLKAEYEAHQRDGAAAQAEIHRLKDRCGTLEQRLESGSSNAAREVANILNYNGSEKGQVEIDGR